MKKLAAILVTLLFASSAWAQVVSNPTTNARMGGLGVDNWQIEDDFNIWINPAQIDNYKNAVYGELGTFTSGTITVNDTNQDGIASSSQWGGMNMDANYGVWGVFLGRPYAGPLNELESLGAGTAPTNNRFDLIYGSAGMPLGFYLGYADRSEEITDPAGKTTDAATEINLGVGGLVGNMLDWAINLGLPSSELKDSAAGTKTEDDASVNVSLLGRHHMPVGGNSKLLSTLRILLGDASAKESDSTGTTKIDDTMTAVDLNFAFNSRPNPDTLVVAAIGLEWEDSEVKVKGAGSKDTFNRVAIPVNFAVEHQTFKKVQTRVGLAKAIYDSSEFKTNDADGDGTTGDTLKEEGVLDGPATVSAGLGWAVADNLMLDAVINQDVLFTGTYVVSGVAETLSSQLSATYRFK